MKFCIFRRETLRVLGLLGALDPYKHKMNLGQIDAQAESAVLVSITDQSEAEASQGECKESTFYI